MSVGFVSYRNLIDHASGDLYSIFLILRVRALTMVFPSTRLCASCATLQRNRKKIYASTRAYIPFSLCSAPKLFNISADLLVWILVVQGVSFVLHYLDDFITVGHPESLECKQNPQTIIQSCQLCTTGLRKGGRFRYHAGVSGHPL